VLVRIRAAAVNAGDWHLLRRLPHIILMLQIAKSLGAHVTAVTSTPNVDLVRSIGADEVVDYTKEDFIRRGQRYDVLFDIGGNRSFADCRRVLAPNGTLVLVGAAKGLWATLSRLLEAQLMSRIESQRIAPFLARVRHEDLVVLTEVVEAGKVSPAIDRQFPLHEVPDALRYLGSRHARGKVVINVDGANDARGHPEPGELATTTCYPSTSVSSRERPSWTNLRITSSAKSDAPPAVSGSNAVPADAGARRCR
jgi:zinc-binding alcohol dehydrogenase family protein